MKHRGAVVCGLVALAALALVAALSVMTAPPSSIPARPTGAATTERTTTEAGGGPVDAPGADGAWEIPGEEATVTPAAGPAVGACWDNPDWLFPEFLACVDEQLVAIAEADGLPASLDAARAYRDGGGELLGSRCHDRMHVVGRLAGRSYDDPAEALSLEPVVDCQAGYMHGVLEGFAQRADVEALLAAMPDLCEPYSDDIFVAGECFHALGHGAAIAIHDSLPAAVELCGVIPDVERRSHCSGGVLMEYGNSFRAAQDPGGAPRTGVDSAESMSVPGRAAVGVDVAAYPCAHLGQDYQHECHRRLASFWSQGFVADIDGFFDRCADLAPVEHHEACGYSAGEYVALQVGVAGKVEAVRSCGQAPSQALQDGCIAGALTNIVPTELAMGREPSSACPSVPASSREHCERTEADLLASTLGLS